MKLIIASPIYKPTYVPVASFITMANVGPIPSAPNLSGIEKPVMVPNEPRPKY